MTEICYRKNYLKQVIAKIDFASPLTDLNNESLVTTVNEIKKRFPLSQQSTAFQQGIEITGKDVKSTRSEFPQWVFSSEDRSKNIKINQSVLEVVLTKYTSDSEFFSDVVGPVSQIIQPRQSVVVARTGMRFVNIFDEIEIKNTTELSDYFSENLTSHIAKITPSDMSSCTRSFLVTEFMNEDIKIRVQTGLFNPDYPAKIKRNHFVIDIDAYIDSPHQINNPRDHLKMLHEAIQNKFESSITDKLRNEVLGGKL